MMIHFWSSQMLLYDADMSYLSYPAYIFNILYIVLLWWKSKESIKWLPITNPGFTDLKEYQEILGNQ